VLAIAYLLAGVAFVVAAVWGLAGFWWALLAAGVLLLVLGALEARGDAVPVPAAEDEPLRRVA
jgi:hypothetical protein